MLTDLVDNYDIDNDELIELPQLKDLHYELINENIKDQIEDPTESHVNFIDQYFLSVESELNENEENIYFSIIKSHNISLLKQMLKSDSKYIYSYNFTKRTLLHQAVMISDYEITKYLLDLGLLANVDDNFGETPLFFAVRNKDLEMIKILIEHGALLGKVNNFFETIYDIASKEVLDYLNYKANNVKYNEYIRKYPLHCAVIYNDYLKAKQLLNKYSVNKKDDYNLLPIDYASKLNHREIYSLLSKYNKK